MDVTGPPFDLQLVELACSLIRLDQKAGLSDWQIERFLELSERFGASFNCEAIRELAAKIESNINISSEDEDAVFTSPSMTQPGCRNTDVSIGIDLCNLKVSPTVITLAVGDTVSFRNIARGSALSSIGIFLKIQKHLDPENIDSDRIAVWEVDYLPPGDPLEWRATSVGEYHFQSESYPFLRGFITVKEPPMTFGEKLSVDIISANPKGLVGKPMVKQKPATLGYGDFKAQRDDSVSARDAFVARVVGDERTSISGLDDREKFEDIPYEALKGEPDTACSSSRSIKAVDVEKIDGLLKEYEKVDEEQEHSFRPATKWSQQPKRTEPARGPLEPAIKHMGFMEVDLDSNMVIGSQPAWFLDERRRNLEAADNQPTFSQARLVSRVQCSCGKMFSSPLNQKRCETLHPLDQSEGIADRKKLKAGGSKKKEADPSAAKSSRLLDLKEFWKQIMLIDERAKILSLQSSEHLRKMSSSLILNFDRSSYPDKTSSYATSGRRLYDLVKQAKDISEHSDPVQRADELDWGNPEWEEIKKILDDTSDSLCFSDPGARLDLPDMTRENCFEAGLGLLVEKALLSTLDQLQLKKKEEDRLEHVRRMEEAQKELMIMFEEEEKKKREQQEKEAVKKAKTKAKAAEMDRKKEEERKVKEEAEAAIALKNKPSVSAVVTPTEAPPPSSLSSDKDDQATSIKQPFVEAPAPVRVPSAPSIGSMNKLADKPSKPIQRVPSASSTQPPQPPKPVLPPKSSKSTTKLAPPSPPLAPPPPNAPPLPSRPVSKPSLPDHPQQGMKVQSQLPQGGKKPQPLTASPDSLNRMSKGEDKGGGTQGGHKETSAKESAPPTYSSSAPTPPPPQPVKTSEPPVITTQGPLAQSEASPPSASPSAPPPAPPPAPDIPRPVQEPSAHLPPEPPLNQPAYPQQAPQGYPQYTMGPGYMQPPPQVMGYHPYMHQPMMSYPMYPPPGSYYPQDQVPMMQPVPMEWMQVQSQAYPAYGMPMPGPYMMMMPAPYMAAPPGWMPPPQMMHAPYNMGEAVHNPYEYTQAQEHSSGPPPQPLSSPPELSAKPLSNPPVPPAPALTAPAPVPPAPAPLPPPPPPPPPPPLFPPEPSSPPPDPIAPTENPATPSRDTAVAVYAKGTHSSDSHEATVIREQETLEQQQKRRAGFDSLLSKSMPAAAAAPEPLPVEKAGKGKGKVSSSRTFNADAAEEDSKVRWNEIQAKMNSKKAK